MDALPGFEKKFWGKVYKLKKSLYGLKQSPRAWFEKLYRFVKKQGYTQGQIDYTMFVIHTGNGKIVIRVILKDK